MATSSKATKPAEDDPAEDRAALLDAAHASYTDTVRTAWHDCRETQNAAWAAARETVDGATAAYIARVAEIRGEGT